MSITTNLINADSIPCSTCHGHGKYFGPGFMQETCWQCNGAKFINTKSEITNAENSKNYAKQNDVENSENAETKTAMDTGAANYSKAKRKYVRKTAVGISE